MRTRWIHLGLWAGALLAGALSVGCAEVENVRLLADDRIVRPGETVEVVARFERRGWTRFFPPSDPPPVRFFRRNELLQEVRPVGTNVVSTQLTLTEPGEHVISAIYQPRPASPPLSANCHAFCWDDSKVAIAIDLDRVVANPSRFDRWTIQTPLGQPRDEAVEVLAVLARQFRLCYLTEQTTEGKETIHEWLATHKLPSGPVITWHRPSRYNPFDASDQAKVLGRLQAKSPTLLIGIGDGRDDLSAFEQNRMLAILIEFSSSSSAPPESPHFLTWRAAWQFFTYESNLMILSDPKRMLDYHRRGGGYLNLSQMPPPPEPAPGG